MTHDIIDEAEARNGHIRNIYSQPDPHFVAGWRVVGEGIQEVF